MRTGARRMTREERSELDAPMRRAMGRRARERRRELGLTLEQLMQRTGLSKGFHSRMENGQSGVDLLNVGVVARALGVSVLWLLGDSEDARQWLLGETTAPDRSVQRGGATPAEDDEFLADIMDELEGPKPNC